MSAPKPLRSRSDRAIARRVRDFQWEFTERALAGVWFSPWNKSRRPEGPDELRCCLMSGQDVLSWTGEHPDWFVIGEWDEEREARRISLTAAGRDALENRESYDMEPVYGGMVEPGHVTIPLARGAS